MAVKPIPDGYHTAIDHAQVQSPENFVDLFLQEAAHLFLSFSFFHVLTIILPVKLVTLRRLEDYKQE